jgi:hypothetical protein
MIASDPSARADRLRLLVALALAVLLLVSGTGRSRAASTGHGRPAGPVNLVVEGRADPLDAQTPLTFGWLPRDDAGDQIQTAYEIRVSDARTGRGVWDSGEVRSSQQSYVPYRGPRLLDGHQYTWTVRTWDRQGRVSPSSARASFDTGIADHEWSGAQWIRRVTTGNDSVIDYTLARRQYRLSSRHGAVVRARVYIAAEGIWQLHVNGHVVDTQYDYQAPGETYYDVENITAPVREAQQARGRRARRLAIGVLYASWPTTEGEPRMEGPVPYRTTLTSAGKRRGKTIDVASVTGYTRRENLAVGTPGTAHPEVVRIAALHGHTIRLTRGLRFAHPQGAGVMTENGPSGLLVKVVVQYANGNSQTFVSGSGWRVTKDTEEVNSHLTLRSGENAGTYVEYLDRTLAVPGWDTVGYRMSRHWVPATVMGPHPLPNPSSCANYLSAGSPCGFTHLIPMQSSLSYRVVHPVSVRRLADGTVTADFGTGLVGIPVVHFNDGLAGRQVDLLASYRLNNTALVTPASAGSRMVALASLCDFSGGDPITIDAPADGYGAGHPETRTIAAEPTRAGGACAAGGPVTLSHPLTRPHSAGAWVQGSRAGTSTLDTQDTDLHFHYTQAAGPQTTDFFVGEGFRYLEISGAHENITPAQIWVKATHENAPPGHRATFTSSDRTLNRVFALMQRAALYAGQEEFNDSPDRQDGQFLMDTIDESMAGMESLDERMLTREAIQNFVFSQRRYWLQPGSQYGEVNAVYPDGDGKRDIPDFTEGFPEWVWRYYMLTGDWKTLALAYPVMRRIATYVRDSVATSGGDAGLVYQLAGGGQGVPGESLFPGTGSYQYGIVDWPPPMRYNTTVLNAGVDTVVNMRAAEVFRATSDAAQALGHRSAAASYASQRSSLVRAINARLVESRTGRYDDGLLPGTDSQTGNASEHDQTFAVSYGVAPPSMDRAIGNYIVNQGMKQGPMDLGQLEQALITVGRPAMLIHLLTDTTADGPAKILAEGGTLMWEQWDPGCDAPGGAPTDSTSSCRGAAILQSSSDSFSHGWGSVGVVGILRGALGLTVTAPGAAAVQVAPPASGLTSARGTEWTERGPVSVSWRLHSGAYALRVNLPDNVVATVSIPDPARTRYAARGAGARRFLGIKNGRALFTIGSGTTRFSPSPRR